MRHSRVMIAGPGRRQVYMVGDCYTHIMRWSTPLQGLDQEGRSFEEEALWEITIIGVKGASIDI